jgi:hypothetical protein
LESQLKSASAAVAEGGMAASVNFREPVLECGRKRTRTQTARHQYFSDPLPIGYADVRCPHADPLRADGSDLLNVLPAPHVATESRRGGVAILRRQGGGHVNLW